MRVNAVFLVVGPDSEAQPTTMDEHDLVVCVFMSVYVCV